MIELEASNSWRADKAINKLVQQFHISYARTPKMDKEHPMHNYIQGIIKGKLREDCFSVSGAMYCYAYTGSTYDGVKVGGDGLEWDIMLRLRGNALSVTQVPGKPGYYIIRPKNLSENPYTKITGSNGQFSAVKAMSQIMGRLKEILNNTPELRQYNIKLVDHGPAVQMDIYKDPEFKKKLYSVDMVPTFDIDGKFYVAKPFRTYGEPNEQNEYTWRISYSLDEKNKFSKGFDAGNGCRKQSLRVCKAMRLDQPELNQLSSYIFKNALFHLNDEKPDRNDWKQCHFAERVIGVWEYIEKRLDEGKMGSYFNKEIDLFDHISPITKENMRFRIHHFCNSQKEFTKIFDNITKKNNSK